MFFDQTPSPAQDLDWITSREGHSMQRIFDGAVWGQSHPQRPGTPATHGMLRIQQNNHLHNTWHFFNLDLWVTVQLGYSLSIHCEPPVYVSTCFFLVFFVFFLVCCLLFVDCCCCCFALFRDVKVVWFFVWGFLSFPRGFHGIIYRHLKLYMYIYTVCIEYVYGIIRRHNYTFLFPPSLCSR